MRMADQPFPDATGESRVSAMSRPVVLTLYALAMIAVIVGVDFALFRNQFLERLIANIGIVLVFAAFYLRFFRRA